jgi:hypothetical protein
MRALLRNSASGNGASPRSFTLPFPNDLGFFSFCSVANITIYAVFSRLCDVKEYLLRISVAKVRTFPRSILPANPELNPMTDDKLTDELRDEIIYLGIQVSEIDAWVNHRVEYRDPADIPDAIKGIAEKLGVSEQTVRVVLTAFQAEDQSKH